MAKYWNRVLRPGWLRRGAVVGLMAGTATVATGCAVSQQQELEMGAQYAAQINQQLPIVDDANLNRYINVLGRQLAARGARGLQYQFYIVNSNVVNAFAVPGGYVYINRGIIERADNVSELAGVLAHEIAHVEHRHGVEQMEKAQSANLGLTLAYVLLGRAPTGVEEAAINIGGGLYFARHSREAENEADRTAVPLMVAAGISPAGLPTFFQELIAERQRSPSALESWFATHPLTEDRIANTQALVNQYSAAQLRNLTLNTQQFTDFKARMRRYAAPPPEPRR